MKSLKINANYVKKDKGLTKTTPDELDLSCMYNPEDGKGVTNPQYSPQMNREREVVELKQLSEILGIILDNVYSGIIFCDKNCNIIFMNQVYAELLGVDRKKAIGKPITEFFPNSRLPYVMRTGMPELGQRCSLKGEIPFLVNRIPIKKGEETIGIILQTIFKDYASFRDLVGKLNLLEKKVSHYKRELNSLLSARYIFEDIKGESNSIREAKRISAKYAKTESSVLLLGATGTGKELFAHAIHTESGRASGPFVCVNCAAIPKELLESELFGYAPGAFTGAHQKGKAGKIELAHKGTLFLDEMGDLPLNAQAKLLRVLEEKMLQRVGDLKQIEVDFRLIAATNKDLADMIRRGEFREELFYRLNTMTIHVPRLVERKEDIPILVNHFLNSMGKSDFHWTPIAMEILHKYSWPGNVRELKNVVERAVSLAETNVIDVEHLPSEIVTLRDQSEGRAGDSSKLLVKELARCEYNLLIEALRLARGNMARTARILGISRSTLYEKCKKHKLLGYHWNTNC